MQQMWWLHVCIGYSYPFAACHPYSLSSKHSSDTRKQQYISKFKWEWYECEYVISMILNGAFRPDDFNMHEIEIKVLLLLLLLMKMPFVSIECPSFVHWLRLYEILFIISRAFIEQLTQLTMRNSIYLCICIVGVAN